jgi:hypothetical protein
MGKKPKARRDLGNDRGESKQKAQSERFIETARAIGVDEAGKEFELALKKIAPTKYVAPKLD